jgi:hypothetical protein
MMMKIKPIYQMTLIIKINNFNINCGKLENLKELEEIES